MEREREARGEAESAGRQRSTSKTSGILPQEPGERERSQDGQRLSTRED